jgi:hypothetical protein
MYCYRNPVEINKIRNELKKICDDTMIVFLAADEARKKYDESNSKLKDTEQELS